MTIMAAIAAFVRNAVCPPTVPPPSQDDPLTEARTEADKMSAAVDHFEQVVDQFGLAVRGMRGEGSSPTKRARRKKP